MIQGSGDGLQEGPSNMGGSRQEGPFDIRRSGQEGPSDIRSSGQEEVSEKWKIREEGTIRRDMFNPKTGNVTC